MIYRIKKLNKHLASKKCLKNPYIKRTKENDNFRLFGISVIEDKEFPRTENNLKGFSFVPASPLLFLFLAFLLLPKWYL